jgi:hypothetical protein
VAPTYIRDYVRRFHITNEYMGPGGRPVVAA